MKYALGGIIDNVQTLLLGIFADALCYMIEEQYLDEKEEREAELKKIRDENSDLAVIRDQDQIRIQEYDVSCSFYF